jgi:predicted transcriptional regulator
MPNKPRIFLTDDQVELARKLFDEKRSVDRVAAEVGVDRAVIDRYRREGGAGFPPMKIRERDDE